jgi:hypothetical protein
MTYRLLMCLNTLEMSCTVFFWKVYISDDNNIKFSFITQTDQWFSPSTPDSSNNKTDHHDITEILLKVALSTINHLL